MRSGRAPDVASDTKAVLVELPALAKEGRLLISLLLRLQPITSTTDARSTNVSWDKQRYLSQEFAPAAGDTLGR